MGTVKKYRFGCGCEFDLLSPQQEGVFPLLDFYIDNIRQDCPEVFRMLASGLTKGCFQLESGLGRHYCKKLRPDTIEHLGALGAILRPGAMQAVDEQGVSMTDHYCRRKNKEEPVEEFHPVISSILSETYNCLIYQEQIMVIGKEIAGFNLVEVDKLRKSVGKKDQKILAEVRDMFMAGAAKTKILNEEQLKTVWGWIQKSGRYSFNRAHSTSYGVTGYNTAYVKCHFPLQFFTAKLRCADQKIDPLREIHELVNEAKLFDIAVEPPDIRDLRSNYYTDRKVIKAGLVDIKGVGDAQIKKLRQIIKEKEILLSRGISSWSWYDFLVGCVPDLTPSLCNKLARAGALRWEGWRQTQIAELEAVAELNDKELGWVAENWTKSESLLALLDGLGHPKKAGGGCSTEGRVRIIKGLAQSLRNPPTSREDSPTWIAKQEKELLGVPLTAFKTDSCDQQSVNSTCKELRSGKKGLVTLCVEVEGIRPTTTKRGKNPGQLMGRFNLTDGTASLEAVAFPECWAEHSFLLTESNTVIVTGEHDKSGDSLIVKKVWQARPAKTFSIS